MRRLFLLLWTNQIERGISVESQSGRAVLFGSSPGILDVLVKLVTSVWVKMALKSQKSGHDERMGIYSERRAGRDVQDSSFLFLNNHACTTTYLY